MTTPTIEAPKDVNYYKAQMEEGQVAVTEAQNQLNAYLAANQATTTPIPVEEFLAGIEEHKAVYTKAMSDMQGLRQSLVLAEKDQENPERLAADLKAAEIFKSKEFQTGLVNCLRAAELLFIYNREPDGTFIGTTAMQLGPTAVSLFSQLCEEAGYSKHTHTMGIILKNGPEGFIANSSVGQVRFSGASPTPAKTRAPAAGAANGQPGQGWIHPETKVVHSLGSAFDLIGSEAERDEVQANQGNNSKQWQIKNKAVRNSGFVQVGTKS